jgi:hypothetical protein
MGVDTLQWDWAKAIGLITAIVTCGTALLTYLRERSKKRPEPESPERLRIRHLSRGTNAPRINLIIKKSLPVVAFFNVGFWALSMWRLVSERSLRTAIPVLVWTVCLVAYVYMFRTFRRGPDAPSKVRHEARVTVDGNYDVVFDRCVRAARRLGAIIISLDRDSGEIRAPTPFTWQSWGQRVDITVIRQGETACSVLLASDSVLPITLMDFGRNARNLELLLQHL